MSDIYLKDVLAKAGTNREEVYDYLDEITADGRANTNNARVSMVCGRFQIFRIFGREIVDEWTKLRPDISV